MNELAEVNTEFAILFQHGSMKVEWYKPDKMDKQAPHRQDELYVIASGSGTFYNDGERIAFNTGDVLFVPAGKDHRFEAFTDDFATWVIFYGPDGGE
jgi:mannose-6-phosphate isomerase-like protein (cupin superfamily)